MINLSNLTARTLQPGQALTFDKVTLKTKNGCECFNDQTPTSVKLCARGIYDVSFSANITGAAGAALQLALALGGTPLVDTAMNSAPAVANNLNSVSARKLIENCCCDLDRLSVVNTSAVPVTVAPGSSLVIIRQA